MRSMTSWLPAVAVIGCLLVTRHVQELSAHPHTSVALTRIYTGSDSQTHAEKVEINLASVAGREESRTSKVTSSHFVRFPPGFFLDWHPAPARRYVITLSGRGEIELTGGQKIPLECGRILQAEDLKGRGHITRTLGNEDWIALFVQFDQ
jgi:hypothetical protein